MYHNSRAIANDVQGLIRQHKECELCGEPRGQCICPPCPKCKTKGNPDCYKPKYPRVYYQRSKAGRPYTRVMQERGHGMKMSNEQIKGATLFKIKRLQDQLMEAEAYLAWLITQEKENGEA